MDSQFKYFAFISYNAKDTAWGKKLQKKLEHYRMTATLCSEHGWDRTPIKPVFFAPTDIQPGGLTEELRERLKASKNLIVICSPNSARSEWVGKEIEFFHSLGRTKDIHFFIVEGTPHSGNPDTECFNPVVDRLGLPEILGANIHEKIYHWPWLNKERAFVQLISKLLGVEFDAIWQRHKRLLARKVAAGVFGIIAVICALIFVWHANQPVNVDIKLNEASIHNNNLPPLKNAIVTLSLDSETKTDTLLSLCNNLKFNNIPHRYLNKPVHFTVSCPCAINLDTTVLLNSTTLLNIYRDPNYYGNVQFLLWDPENEKAVANETVYINGYEVSSDNEGMVLLFIPLGAQDSIYTITSRLELENNRLPMPCGLDDAVIVKPQ